MKLMAKKQLLVTVLIMSMVMFFAVPLTSFAESGSIKTSDADLQTNANVSYAAKDEVYVRADALPEGNYWIRVMQTQGDTVLGTSGAPNFVVDSTGSLTGSAVEVVKGTCIVQLTELVSFADSSNDEYKVEVILDSGQNTLPESWNGAKSDNFKVGDFPAITLEKTVRLAGMGSYKDALTVTNEQTTGDTVTVEYQFVVKNEGSVKVTDISVYDETLGGVIDSTGALNKHKSVTFTTTHSISISEFDNNQFINTATAGAVYNNNPITSDPDTATVNYKVLIPSIDIQKEVSLAETGDFVDSLTVTSKPANVEYLITVTNTGEYDFNSVILDDELLSVNGFDLGSLKQGQSTTTTVAFTIDDWGSNNSFINTATATGIYSLERSVTDNDSATVQYENVNPELSLVKGVRLAGTENVFTPTLTVTSTGAAVEYQFTVENTGNVGLNATVYDQTLNWTSEPEYIAPGSLYKFTTTPFAITAWNSENSFTNIATAGAFYNDKPVSSNVSTAVVQYKVQADLKPVILLEKTVNPTSVNSRTAEVTYTFKITNKGDYDFADVILSDLPIGVYSDLGPLTQGQSITTTSAFVLSAEIWTGNTYTNTAEVKGYFNREEDYVSASAIATVTYSTGGGGGDRDRDRTITVNPEPTPAAPIEIPIIDDPTPAAPLPQTGGIPALLFFGMGSLIAGGGVLLRRKEK